MDINLEFEKVLKSEKERLVKIIQDLNSKLEQIWIHPKYGRNENSIVYNSSLLTSEDLKNGDDLNQRLNEAYAKLDFFNYLINQESKNEDRTTGIAIELVKYSNISISSNFTTVNKNDTRNKIYSFVMFNGLCFSNKSPNMSFEHYMKQYKDSFKRSLMLIFLKSKGISKNNLSENELIGYQMEFGLEMSDVLAQVCSSLLQETHQATPTTK